MSNTAGPTWGWAVRVLLLVTAAGLCGAPAVPAVAAVLEIGPEADLQAVLAAAQPGDEILLQAGTYAGDFVIDKPVSLRGPADHSAVLQGTGEGRTLWLQAPGISIRSLTVRGSGMDLFEMDAAIFLDREAQGAVIEDNHVLDNLIGIYVRGAADVQVRGNRVVGNGELRMSERGNGIQLWNAPGTEVVDNEIRSGRDGIYTDTSKHNSFRNNRIADVRFGVHYMYTQDSELVGNEVSGSQIGYALMMSDRLVINANRSLDNREQGIALNAINRSVIEHNYVEHSEKCVFLYNSNMNEFRNNRFEDCEIGIHFTAGAERNRITDNAFVGNRTQVKYVSTRYLDWSVDGRGNYWSDNSAFDLDGDGIADSAYRPNGILDQVLWRAPMAKVLLNSPATQIVRWAQSQFPALYPGGVVDSAPLMAAPEVAAQPSKEQK
ncbi:nitrous oxide reductase family maturation protein NosD [Corticimicrobacter populi]|uniref:Nitrous oxide reductase family maturation protein NosD n=1 Tax=Corticimicrobacter populi TaxID=2175229 RepID=A0A2V1JYN7_9BURK|nr:nitrous oxide reductase family maturation protein NosD [Corticimicrobacter populi]PWF21522.1 nitrous oxide reductase family maturation protein NosD [Corticimicrobacter populi]